MFAWIRRVFVGIGRYLDLVSRIEEVERELERIRGDMQEYQLEWGNQVDKLTSMHKRATKRMHDEARVVGEIPQMDDVGLTREQRKQALRNRAKTNA